MVTFTGTLKALAGEIRTWQELLLRAIDERDYGSATNRQHMKDRFYAASGVVKMFKPAANIFIIDANKGNTNGTLAQASWALPGDVTGAAPGTANEYDGGVEYSRDYRVSLGSEAVYAAADTEIDVVIVAESII